MNRPQAHQHRGDAFITRAAGWSAVTSAGLVLVLNALAWVVSYGLGGSQTVGPQLFHIPTVLAATRFGARGAATSAVVAGILCGPLLPLDVGEGTAQSFANWSSRLVIFLAVGQIVAALHTRSLEQAGRRLHDHQVANALRAAVSAGEFVPAYQPIVDLRDGTILGVEALARWRRPGGEILSPAAFVPDAERTGAIDEIDRAVFRGACAQVRAWQRAGLVRDDLRLSVNVSAHHLADPGLAARVQAILEETGMAPARVVLEITETSLVDDPDGAAWRLAELRAVGVAISLDDFGVGQSSLGNLCQFPIDAYKIDRSFITGAETTPRGRALVGSVIRLADSLALAPPVAEGIETVAQLRTLRELGCERGQGFLFARPALAADIEEVLRHGTVSLVETT